MKNLEPFAEIVGMARSGLANASIADSICIMAGSPLSNNRSR